MQVLQRGNIVLDFGPCIHRFDFTMVLLVISQD